jgi:hypothetical protein|tara:strand:+ start:1864 stop:2052 length:189 start_codon:yes stop_codon:yes gene_type:complete
VINKFVIIATSGIMLFSSGLCLFGEALIRKYQGIDFFTLGTLSLILINAGVCIMISSKELSN